MFLHYRRILNTFFFQNKFENTSILIDECRMLMLFWLYVKNHPFPFNIDLKHQNFFKKIELVLNDLIKLKKISYQYLVFLSLECNIPLQEDCLIWLVYITCAEVTIAYLLDYSPWMDIYFNYLVPFLVWSYNQRS